MVVPKHAGFLAVLWLMTYSLISFADGSRVLLYPRANDDWRAAYPVELLSLALAASGKDYVLHPGSIEVPKARNFLNLANHRDMDVVWSMTNIEREQNHLPIRIPIVKGLMGYRLALIRAKEPEILAGVHNLAQLKQFNAGQMYVWTDAKILTSQGISVVPGANYESLFRMLAAGRFDFFPRSVTEVSQELEQVESMGIALDQHLLIRYPTAMYFFVNKTDTELAADIEAGLEKVLASGEFDALFERYFADLIRNLHLETRRAIDLNNPLLPAATPLCRTELWWMNLCPAR